MGTNFRNKNGKINKAKFETRKKKKNDPAKWIHKRNLRPERRRKTTQRSGSTSEILGQKEEEKRPSEVDPQAKFETRKKKKNDPEKWIHKRNLRPERRRKTTREVDPQAKFETRKKKKTTQ